jgi:hypothetical protein
LGEVALAIGRYNVQVPIKPGTLEVDRGKYVGHWRRMPDGQFRVTVSMWLQRPLAPRDFVDGDREAVAVVVGNDLQRIGRKCAELCQLPQSWEQKKTLAWATKYIIIREMAPLGSRHGASGLQIAHITHGFAEPKSARAWQVGRKG